MSTNLLMEAAMNWLGVLLIMPLWGFFSAKMFFRGLVGLISLLISLHGFLRGAVARKTNAVGMGAGAVHMAVSAAVLYACSWILVGLRLGQSGPEVTVYNVFLFIAAILCLKQIPPKLRQAWRNATIPGEIELNILDRKVAEIKRQSAFGRKQGEDRELAAVPGSPQLEPTGGVLRCTDCDFTTPEDEFTEDELLCPNCKARLEPA
jgi:hypothetical protein